MKRRYVTGLVLSGSLLSTVVIAQPAAGGLTLETTADQQSPDADEGVVLTLEEGAARMGMSVDEFRDHSSRLDVLDDIEETVGGDPGFYAASVDAPSNAVEVMWRKGHKLPDELRAARRSGVSTPVTYVSVSSDVREWEGGDDRPAAPGVTGVGYDVDQGGFVVSTAPGDEHHGQSASALQSKLKLPAPVVKVEKLPGDGAAAELSSRWSDTGVHNPGSRARNTGEAQTCTAAFKVKRDTGTEALLTAAHCLPGGFYNDSNYMGSVLSGASTTYNTIRDIALISGDQNGYGASTYVGWYNSSSLVRTTSPLTPAKGLKICAGGAASGEVCGGVIDTVNDEINGHKYVFTAHSTGELGLAGGWDSGGPIYTYHYTSTGTYLRPVGLISSGFRRIAACQGLSNPNRAGQDCWLDIAGAQITTAQSAMFFDIVSSSED